jgi:hypothetical protein
MLAHIANHLSIPEGKEKAEPEREEEEKEAEE